METFRSAGIIEGVGVINFNNRDVFIVTATLKASAGGRTRSLIQRGSILAEYAEENVDICYVGYNPNSDIDMEEVSSKKLFHPNLRVHNLYDDIAIDNGNVESISHPHIDPGYDVIDNKGRRFTHFKDGVKLYLKDFEKSSGKLHHINYYAEDHSNVERRDHYDFKGYVHRRDYFDIDGDLIREVLVDRSGKAYLTKQYSLIDHKRSITAIFYFGSNLPRFEFRNMDELYTSWLSTKVKRETVFISDARIMDEAVLNIKNNGVKKLFQLHNNYHSNPMDSSSLIKDRAKTLRSRINEADRVVGLTYDQINAFLQAAGGRADKGDYIPHSIEPAVLCHERVPHQVVIVARLADQKRIADGLLAFKKFHSKHPEYKLDIYGDGVDKEAIVALIDREKMASYCSLKGFTPNASKCFQQAAFSIVSSKFEGFPLSIMESLANGCPVVSYDINFGPRDLIHTGVNGMLAKAGDVDDLSEKMSDLAMSDIVGDSQKVQDSILHLSPSVFAKKWCDLISSV